MAGEGSVGPDWSLSQLSLGHVAAVKALWSEDLIPLLRCTAAALLGLMIGVSAIWLAASWLLEWLTSPSLVARFHEHFAYKRLVLAGMAPQLVLASALGPWLRRTSRGSRSAQGSHEAHPITSSIPEFFIGASLAYCAIAPAVVPPRGGSSSGGPIELILLYLGMTTCVTLALVTASHLSMNPKSRSTRQLDERGASSRAHGDG